MLHLRRAEAAAAVLDALRSAGLPLAALYGSWAHGDFHLDESTSTSLSDVDLVLPDHSPQDRAELTIAVERNLPTGAAKRVTARAANDLGNLVPSAHMWITLAAYATALRREPHRTAQVDGYLTAKTLLMLLRSSSEERYAQIAQRLNTPHANRALAIKLGAAVGPLPLTSEASLLALIEPVYRGVFVEMRAHGHATDQQRRYILDSLIRSDCELPNSLISHTRANLGI